ncbi:MAG: glycosyltransferase family 4 protein [Erysipelotrichaceae bacterium]|nr:glycosyltransferase family 4 protein [Erysipelotrichaceae bacterium]
MNKLIVITSNIAPYRLKWCEELSKHYEVTIVYTKDHDYERDDRWLQKSSKSCKIIKLKNDKDLYDALCFDVIDVIKENKDSLIIFDGYGPKTNLLGLLYCKLTGRHSFTNVDGYALGEKESKIRDIVKKNVISHLCDYIFCSSESTKKHLISCGAKKDKVYVHNFSSITDERILKKPLSYEDKISLREKLGIDTKGKIVLGVGAFIPRKRFEDLIEAVINCKSECDLYLLGGKPTEEYLKMIGDRTNFHFIDFVLPNEVDQYYQMADLFVLSSQTDVWGLVLNEALAQGLPSISSDNCIAGKSLIDGNGVVYRTGDIKELTDAIDYCLDDERNKEMSIRSLEISHNFTIENMVVLQKPYIDEYFSNRKI